MVQLERIICNDSKLYLGFFFFIGKCLKLKIISPFLWLNFHKPRIISLRFGNIICNSSFTRGK
jgi:hypothetical protein